MIVSLVNYSLSKCYEVELYYQYAFLINKKLFFFTKQSFVSVVFRVAACLVLSTELFYITITALHKLLVRKSSPLLTKLCVQIASA